MTEALALLDEGLGNSAYLVDLGDGRALVADVALISGKSAEQPGRTATAATFTRSSVAHAGTSRVVQELLR